VTPDEALARAYRYLGRRERTVAETRVHLGSRGADADTVEHVVATLIDQGYLDDRRFVRLFAEDKRSLEQWGQERIRRSLVARGIAPDLASAAPAQAGGPDGDGQTELERATALLRRRFAGPPEDGRQRERALGLLLRKGYEYELACDALRAHARAGSNLP
jgi:regulatory protein